MFYWGKLTHLKKLYEKVKAEKSQDKLEKKSKVGGIKQIDINKKLKL